jgi:hypothetical protein
VDECSQKQVIDDVKSKVDDMHRAIIGEPPTYENGMVHRVARLEGADRRRRFWTNTVLVAAIGSMVAALAAWCQGK